MKQYNVAVVGATGMVGNKFLQVLTEKNLPVKNYYLYASAKSAGKVINFHFTLCRLTKYDSLVHTASAILTENR